MYAAGRDSALPNGDHRDSASHAARQLTTSGMPTEMVRDYLRHSDITTTMGYLHLVGGHSVTEQRRWLS